MKTVQKLMMSIKTLKRLILNVIKLLKGLKIQIIEEFKNYVHSHWKKLEHMNPPKIRGQ